MSMRVHVSLSVEDLERAGEFYRRLFGRPASKEREGYVNFRLDEPPIHLALHNGTVTREERRAGIQHLGVELEDLEQLDDWRRRLAEAGVKFRHQPQAECCYATGEKLWVTDPDQHVWEIWVRTGESGSLADSETFASCCA